MNPNEPQTRRSFLDLLLALCGAITAAAVAIPGVAYLWPAAKGGDSQTVEIPGASDMAPGQSIVLQVGSTAVVIVRGRSGFKAFSAICSHLGCLVKWDGGRKEFSCPCHAAIFDENGLVVSGPPPSPMVEYTVKEVADKVYVSESA